jgi:hypothetical protein
MAEQCLRGAKLCANRIEQCDMCVPDPMGRALICGNVSNLIRFDAFFVESFIPIAAFLLIKSQDCAWLNAARRVAFMLRMV